MTYNNVAKSEDAAQTAHSVFVNGQPICHKKSIFSKSTGDEAGDQKGQKSGTIQGKAEFITASSNILIEGIPAVRDKDLMVSNNRNTPPAPLKQSGGQAAQNMPDTQQPRHHIDQPYQSQHQIYGTNLSQLFDLIRCS